MNCPKCAKRMDVYCGVSQASQLTRQDEASASMVYGYRCWNCGKWVDVEMEPVRGMPVEEIRPRYNPGIKSQAFFVVERFFESIALQRESGASWYCVAKLLAQAGQLCQEKTLQKYFLLEKNRRSANFDGGCGLKHGEAQKT